MNWRWGFAYIFFFILARGLWYLLHNGLGR